MGRGGEVSGKLLLDEKGPQMRELPCACDAQHNQLQQRPSHDPGVRALGLVSKLGFSFLVGCPLLAMSARERGTP